MENPALDENSTTSSADGICPPGNISLTDEPHEPQITHSDRDAVLAANSSADA